RPHPARRGAVGATRRLRPHRPRQAAARLAGLPGARAAERADRHADDLRAAARRDDRRHRPGGERLRLAGARLHHRGVDHRQGLPRRAGHRARLRRRGAADQPHRGRRARAARPALDDQGELMANSSLPGRRPPVPRSSLPGGRPPVPRSSLPGGRPPVPPEGRKRPGHLRRALRTPLGVSAAVLLALVLLLAVLAPVLWSSDASAIDTFAILQGPSGRHWLGTNNLGQDVFYRVLVATRLSVGLALAATAI